METEFHRTQVGWVTGGGLLLAVVLCAALVLAELNWIALGVMILMALLFPIFATLSVAVSEGNLRFRMGVGLIRRRIPISDISSCEPVRNRWWWGWGIRMTPHGWLYNVSGLDAVQIERKDGRRIRIGCADPRALCEAVRRAAGTEET